METLIITSIGKLPRETITYYELTYGVMINDCGCCGYEVSGEQDCVSAMLQELAGY
jgi:hypothetical protein